MVKTKTTKPKTKPLNKHTFFPITSLCKEDIRIVFKGHPNYASISRRISRMTDTQMFALAEDLADDYCEQLYWISLEELFKRNTSRRLTNKD